MQRIQTLVNFPIENPIAFLPRLNEDPQNIQIIDNPCAECVHERLCIATPYHRKYAICWDFVHLVYWRHNLKYADIFMKSLQTYSTYENNTLERLDMEVSKISTESAGGHLITVLNLTLNGDLCVYPMEAILSDTLTFEYNNPPFQIQPKHIIRAHLRYIPTPEPKFYVNRITFLAPSKYD